MKKPAFQFYPGDWLKDPRLSLCSPATRGVWIDLICALHELGHGGQVTGTVDQLARLGRCTGADMHGAISELQTTQAADISERDGAYTIICRRLRREAERQQIYRVNGSKRAAKYEPKPEYEDEGEVEEKVISFCLELGLPRSDGAAVFQKWKGNGWTNGGRPIKDWKSTIRSWKHSGYMPSQKRVNGQPPARRDLI